MLVSQEPVAKFRIPWIAPSHPSYKWWVTATVMLGAFLVVVSGATVNVALPPIMTTFRAYLTTDESWYLWDVPSEK